VSLLPGLCESFVDGAFYKTNNAKWLPKAINSNDLQTTR
jgi:hypothetical protein